MQFWRAIMLGRKTAKKKKLTEKHPDAKAYPRVHVKHNHQIDVDEDAECGKKRDEWNLQIAKKQRQSRFKTSN